eukprot:591009-Rhodomonas_salina.2
MPAPKGDKQQARQRKTPLSQSKDSASASAKQGVSERARLRQRQQEAREGGWFWRTVRVAMEMPVFAWWLYQGMPDKPVVQRSKAPAQGEVGGNGAGQPDEFTAKVQEQLDRIQNLLDRQRSRKERGELRQKGKRRSDKAAETDEELSDGSLDEARLIRNARRSLELKNRGEDKKKGKKKRDDLKR